MQTAKLVQFVRFLSGILLLVQYSACIAVHEKVFCGTFYIPCSSGTTIRVVQAIEGRIVGRNECRTSPMRNCTKDVTCKISESANTRTSSPYIYLSNKDFCSGEKRYMIVKYMCGKWEYSLDGENFALNKPAVQSSLPTANWGGRAFKAVDGDINTGFYHKGRPSTGSCTYTEKTVSPWWRVDLEQRIAVSHVNIYNRGGEASVRLCGFQIRIGDTIARNGTENPRCGRLYHIPSNKNDVVACEPPRVGRYVTIVLAGRQDYLTLCEVQVYGTTVLGEANLTQAELVGSNLPYEGQVVLNGETFCDPQWSQYDANTTCIQLGYPKTAQDNSMSRSFTGKSAKNPVNKYFNCTGQEGSLSQCSLLDDDGDECATEKTVTVRCQPYTRLTDSSIPLQGRVQVLHLGVWGTVCGKGDWTKENARVVCHELGFYDAVSQDLTRSVGVQGKIWLEKIKCKGYESSLVFCEHNWKKYCTHHYYDGTVECSICAQPLLRSTVMFPDSVFYALASRGPDHLARFGRLYSPTAWCLPDFYTDVEKFLEINMGGIFSISAIATVGGKLGFVTSYKFSYVVDGNTWSFATIHREQIIPGNTNNETQNVIRRELDKACHVWKARFIPETMTGVPCMRVELCGKEITRCEPPNIAIESVTATSVRITWKGVPGISTLHKGYSVTLRDKNGNDFINTTQETSITFTRLHPNHEYHYMVSAGIGLECFKNATSGTTFTTLEDVPSGSPNNVKVQQVGPTTLSFSWSPPDETDQNGKITNYSVCLQMTRSAAENCTSCDGTVTWTTVMSLVFKDTQQGRTYFVWVRAYTEIGPGPCTQQKRIVTDAGPALTKSATIETTSSSFGLNLQAPKQGFSYIQIIVMKLGNESQAPALSLSFTKDQISTENTSVGIFKCYVTAELSVSHVTKDFTIGDGRNYKRVSTSRRRRETDGLLSFYNRPLEAGLFYAAFQRTFKDEDTYYSSSWTEPIQTLTITRTDPDPDASINSGAAAVYAGVAIGVVILIIIAAVIVLLVLKKRRRRKSDADRATTNIVLKQVPRDSDISKVNIAADHDDDADTDSETDVAGGLNDQEAVYGNFNGMTSGNGENKGPQGYVATSDPSLDHL